MRTPGPNYVICEACPELRLADTVENGVPLCIKCWHREGEHRQKKFQMEQEFAGRYRHLWRQ